MLPYNTVDVPESVACSAIDAGIGWPNADCLPMPVEGVPGGALRWLYHAFLVNDARALRAINAPIFALPAPKLSWRASNVALKKLYEIGRILETETFPNQSNRQGTVRKKSLCLKIDSRCYEGFCLDTSHLHGGTR